MPPSVDSQPLWIAYALYCNIAAIMRSPVRHTSFTKSTHTQSRCTHIRRCLTHNSNNKMYFIGHASINKMHIFIFIFAHSKFSQNLCYQSQSYSFILHVSVFTHKQSKVFFGRMHFFIASLSSRVFKCVQTFFCSP